MTDFDAFAPPSNDMLKGLRDLPQPDQIGFVVKDLARAIELYDPLFGPFTVPDFGPQTASYRGVEPTPFTEICLWQRKRAGNRTDRVGRG